MILAKANSDGTTTDVTSTTAVADANGKIAFSFSSIPTNSDANFLMVTVKGPTLDATGTATPITADTVVRQSLAPAPPSGSSNSAGLNTLSYAQTKAMLLGFAAAKSDDPIFASFGFVILRTPGISEADIVNIATGGKNAILGDGGFVSFLTTNGVTASQLQTFRQKLISNPGFRALPDFTAKFKDAVENTTSNPTLATKDMAEGGGFMGDIFVDAASAAGIDLQLITSAFDAAGEVSDSDSNLMAISSTVNSSMGQAIKNFFTRIAASKVKREYTAALAILNASVSQISRYNTGVDSMITAFQSLEGTYGKYFEDPTNNQMTDAIKAEMDAAFQSAFTTFQSAIVSTDAEITTLRTSMASSSSIPGATLSAVGYGSYRDQNGASKNWPIPQAALHQWVIDAVLANGGSLTYTVDTIAIPSSMSWLTSRTNFSGLGMPTSLASLMGLEEDMRIIEQSKFALFMSGTPSRAAIKAADLLFQQRVDARATALGGTTNGTTAITTAQKQAIVKLMIQPNIH
ncbi:MAG: hypothetical protein Q7T03_07835 [Deltaproteobacteria bacterium]|nr:hypothetical protein [Deltaproteobacteria bacterium]